MTDTQDWIPLDEPGFIGLVGPLYHRPFDGGDTAWFRFIAEDKHRNRNNVVHGGMLTTFADRALGFTVRRGDLTRRQATIQLDTHFIKAVQIGDTVDFEGHIIRETRTFVFADGNMTVNGDIVATARGIWRYWQGSRLAAADTG
jgi:acyl-coenzyme A thioesterase PaaI-like protein